MLGQGKGGAQTRPACTAEKVALVYEAGGVEAVVGAMRAHPHAATVQQHGFKALYHLASYTEKKYNALGKIMKDANGKVGPTIGPPQSLPLAGSANLCSNTGTYGE